MFNVLPARILGTGHALPKTEKLSTDFDHCLNLNCGHLEQATGVIARRICTNESQIDLAVQASRVALDDAGINLNDIDLVIGASGLPYQALPSTAPLIMRELGMNDGSAQAFDVNSTCLSFVTALDIAATRIAMGQARMVLVVSSEVASKTLPWSTQPEVAALFGDGAGAAILTTATPGQGCIRASMMRTYPSAYEASSIASGGTRIDFHTQPEEFAQNAVFHMDGTALFRVTHRHFSGFVDDLLQCAGWSEGDVDLIVPHQASPIALEHMIRSIGLDTQKVVTIASPLGTHTAASILTALDIARKDGRIRKGTRLLILGTSAGVSFGGMAIEV